MTLERNNISTKIQNKFTSKLNETERNYVSYNTLKIILPTIPVYDTYKNTILTELKLGFNK
jgi:hypothetical protein